MYHPPGVDWRILLQRLRGFCDELDDQKIYTTNQLRDEPYEHMQYEHVS